MRLSPPPIARYGATLATLLGVLTVSAQTDFTRADTLRGSIGPHRAWWDVTHYDVTVKPDFATKSIQGTTRIMFTATAEGQRMQIDLQQPLVVDSIIAEIFERTETGGTAGTPRLHFAREGDVVWVDLPSPIPAGTRMPITVHYHGKPREARNPPWDGGWIWKTDERGNPWMTVACQGLGASVWYPCKDHQSDEPEGAALHIVVPDTLVGVGNGRFNSTTPNGDGTTTWHWRVSAPINAYNLVPYIGKYVRFGEQYTGAEGPLDLDHWVLAHNEAKAREHFKQVPTMLRCFEEWLGPYPFRADGFKLVEAPHLGMEHQSAVAYGNRYANGYLGRDLSGTGHGLLWDFIIVHESGHEWFGNSITTADIADMWVHEGFTQYTEVIMTECMAGTQAASEYVIGLRANIRNDRPIIGPYGVNTEGSGDMYPKGANLVHIIRHIIGDDRFRAMLLEMTTRYRHRIVTSAEIEAFISTFAGVDLSKVFDQYLRTTDVPVLEWGVHKRRLWLRWNDAVEGFAMPVRVWVNERAMRVEPTTTWAEVPGVKVRGKSALRVDPNWYVTLRRTDPPRPPLPAAALHIAP
jgi:aminopeptidase N